MTEKQLAERGALSAVLDLRAEIEAIQKAYPSVVMAERVAKMKQTNAAKVAAGVGTGTGTGTEGVTPTAAPKSHKAKAPKDPNAPKKSHKKKVAGSAVNLGEAVSAAAHQGEGQGTQGTQGTQGGQSAEQVEQVLGDGSAPASEPVADAVAASQGEQAGQAGQVEQPVS